MEYKKILIAIDDSRYSLKVVKKGFGLARKLGAEAALVYVIDSSKALGEIDANIYPQDALLALKEKVMETFDKLMKKYNGKSFVKFAPEGIPKKIIIKTADSWNADLIVMGSHGKSGLNALLMGSVTQYVISHSHIPVMIIPSKY